MEEQQMAKATAKYVRISPRKARLVVDEIRNKSVSEARAILKYSPNKAARFTLKVLNSAVANAVNNNGWTRNACTCIVFLWTKGQG